MRPLTTLRSLNVSGLHPVYSLSPITHQRSASILPSPQHLHIRFLHTTNHPLSTPQAQPQPDQESESGRGPEPQSNALIYPSRSTPSNHHDLPSFLAYAERTNLAPKSTVYVGTHYEYTVQESLASHGFAIHRVGGASDHGIDLLGTWNVPSLPHPLRVIVQCKALASPRPASIRELEGAFVGAPTGWRKDDGMVGSNVLGLLVAPGQSTKGIRDAIGRSRWPMGFVSCMQMTGAVRQFIWNQAAVREGLEGVGVTFRHDENGGEPTLLLTWKGRPMSAAVEQRDVAE